MSELKGCPFCGGTDMAVQIVVHKLTENEWPWRVICNGCGAETDRCRTREVAIAAWNERKGND